MSMSKTLNPLLSTGSTLVDPKIVDWDIKNQISSVFLTGSCRVIECCCFFVWRLFFSK